MFTQKIAALLGRGLKRGAKGRTTTRQGARRGERRLTIESLEGRKLLAVATIERTFKDFDFAGPVTLTGNLTGRYGSNPVNGRFSGNLSIDGNLDYSSPLDGVGEASAVGPVSGSVIGFGTLPPLTLDGETPEDGLTETNGKFTAVLPAQGSLGPVTLNGTINTRDWSATGTIKFTLNGTINGSGTWRGTLAPENPTPLTVDVVAQWDPVKFGTVDVNVTAGGSVQNAATRSTAVATVRFFWASSTGGKLRTLPDTIPVLWNQATGSYEVSNLSAPPTTATKLLVETKYGTTTKTTLLDLPARPTISISNVSVTPPTTGTVDAVFTVSLSGPTLSNVTVRFATANGTAIQNQDFLNRTGTLTFTPGGPTTQTIAVKVRRDTTVANEEFYLQLSRATWGTIDGTGRGVGSIIDIP